MNIGFIGLGKMGSAIAGHLLASGHSVRMWNRSSGAAQELVAKGAVAVGKPTDVVHADFLLSMLANDAAVRAVILDQGVLDAAPAGLLHVNLATVSVALAQELAAAHRKRDLAYIAAPVFGRPDVAGSGKLQVVVAGDPAAVARAQPVLEAIGQKTWPVGDRPESANAVKLAGNFMIASAIESMAEAVALTSAHGIDAGPFLEILTGTLFDSRAYKVYSPMIAAGKYEPAGFEATLGLKDIRLALEAAEAHHVPMPFASVLRDNFLQLIAMGGGKRDWSALAQVAAHRAGLDQQK